MAKVLMSMPLKTVHRVSERLKILDNNFTNIKHTNGDNSIEQSPLTIVYMNVTPSVHRIQECLTTERKISHTESECRIKLDGKI